jgi:hypothetical protein
MPTLITHDEFEENLLLNPRLTMALPYLAHMVISPSRFLKRS